MNLREHWLLDPEVTFLNHGSFGACPKVILELQTKLRYEMEREPVMWIGRELEGRLDSVRERLGAFLGADADDLAFVNNASMGVSTVLRSLDLKPNDELVTTNHVYGSCKNALYEVAEPRGARVVIAEVPFPITSSDVVVERVLSALTPRTKLILIDHITSATGLIFPVEQIVREAEARGIDVLIDGAHAPGMIELDLRSLNAAYYTGNCHKWLCTPKGSAVLHVRKDRQAKVRSMVVSHGARSPRQDRSRFRLDFDFPGTDDFTPFLCVPAGIDFLSGLYPGGLEQLRRENKAKVLAGREILLAKLGIDKPAPDAMIGSLVSMPLPDSNERPKRRIYHDVEQERLFEEKKIEVMIFPYPTPPKRLLRIAAQAYNSVEEYQKLAAELRP
jgi:isopenicillin-N epimerase